MLKVILDTNAMIYSFDNKKDINAVFDRSVNDSFRLYSLDACIGELKGLDRNDVVLWTEKNNVTILTTREGGKTDDKILEEAAKSGYAVMTEDRELMKRARDRNVKLVRFAGSGLSIS